MARICQRCQHSNEDHAKFCLSCGGMLEVEVEGTDADPLLGKVIQGRYRPTKLLGEGGMGRVYIAEQKMGAATRKVAIKTLHPEFSQDAQLVARFNRECETVIELSHPNTIQFFDFGSLDDQTLFIVMEYIEGKSLASVMEQGLLDVPRVDKILIQMCGSLHEAHNRGIVHRDLKPENVLLTDRGGQTDFVKVLDFGIAKKGEAEDPAKAKLTKQGMVLGTPPYMSPEQFSGKTLDLRSDIYSLGIMAFEMLTGHLPFDAKTPWEWATKHLTASPTPFEAYPHAVNIPQIKKNAVNRALSKAPEQRHNSVLEFLQEFTGYQDQQSAWTMATSSGGAILPKSDGARPPNPTPAPMTFGQQTPPPGYGALGTHPGMGGTASMGMGGGQMGTGQMGAGQMMAPTGQMPSYGGASPAPGGMGPGYPSNPGMNPYGSAPSYATGTMSQPQPQQSSGGGAGRIIAIALMGLFVVGGSIGAAGLYFIYGRDTGTTTTTSTPPPPTTGPTVITGTMQPMLPTTTTVPPTTTGDIPTTPPTTVAAAGVDAGTAAAPDHATERHVSAADEAQARAESARGLASVDRHDWAGAIASLRQVQHLVGRSGASARQLQDQLDSRGGNQVGILLQQGYCPQAQALYRDLRGVGAGTAARRQFSDDWCPAPH
jgi:tRNA A-37 threonylcarbamoyl transferase component Bud32